VPAGIAVSGDVGNVLDRDGRVTKLDLDAVHAMATLVQIPGAQVVAAGAAGTWVASNKAVLQIADFAKGEHAPGHGPVRGSSSHEAQDQFDATGIAVGRNGVWVVGAAPDWRLFRIDPQTAQIVLAIRLPFVPSAVAVGAALWVTDQLDDQVVRIDPATGQILATIDVGREPMVLAAGRLAVWVADGLDETVSRIDPATNRVVSKVRIEAEPKAIAADGSSVWVAANAR
jgi:YVTN family beta-propeller protein